MGTMSKAEVQPLIQKFTLLLVLFFLSNYDFMGKLSGSLISEVPDLKPYFGR
jgi:hypothetical protein